MSGIVDGLEPLQRDATPESVLLSVDLEDVRLHAVDAQGAECRVRHNMERILDFCEERGLRLTCFVVGEIARRMPDLVGEVAARGHEIACHSDLHRGIDTLARDEFRADTQRNVDALLAAGVERVEGYRSPFFSLVPETGWVWEALAELGFRYSSSVLPSANPQYGWRGFPPSVTRHRAGIWELPISTTGWPIGDIPYAGGAYLRLLPSFLVRSLVKRRLRTSKAIVSYIHPYDVDHDDAYFRVVSNPLMNRLLYYNRRSTLPKMAALARAGGCLTYRDYIERVESMKPS